MVGHLLQYHPAFIKLKEMAVPGELGRINYIYSHRLNLGKIRREENILWSFAPHDISMILSLAGEEPESIQTTGRLLPAPAHRRCDHHPPGVLQRPQGSHFRVLAAPVQGAEAGGGRRPQDGGLRRHPWTGRKSSWSTPTRSSGRTRCPCRPRREPEQGGHPAGGAAAARSACISWTAWRTANGPSRTANEGLRVLKILNASQRSLDQQGKRIRLDGSLVAKDETAARPVQPRPAVTAGAFVHETAIVDPGAVVGAGTKIWHFSHVLSGSTDRRALQHRPERRHRTGCHHRQQLQNPEQRIGLQGRDPRGRGFLRTFHGVHQHLQSPGGNLRRWIRCGRRSVKKGATIGANATIVCGTTLGRYCFVGAGAVVTRNVPDHALVLGNPAKQIGWMCHCGERLSDDLECLACGNSYQKSLDGLILKQRKTDTPVE